MHIYTSGAIFRKGGQKCGQGRGAFYLQQTRVLYIYSSIYTGAVKHLFFISQIQIYYTYVAVYSYYLRLRNSQCTNGFRIQKHINHLIAHFIELKKVLITVLHQGYITYLIVSNKDCIVGHALQVTIMLVCIECIQTNNVLKSVLYWAKIERSSDLVLIH